METALELEDKISVEVYGPYKERAQWPENLPDETFAEIVKRLNILITETEGHKKAISSLQEKFYG